MPTNYTYTIDEYNTTKLEAKMETSISNENFL